MKSDFKKVIGILEQLHKDYPAYQIGKNISSAVDDCWALSDKDLYEALVKYRSTLEMDPDVIDEDWVKDIVEDGQHLFDKNDDDEDN